MNLKYVLGAIISVPLLPILYVQGRHIRKTVPKLPEASGTEGITKTFKEKNTLHLLTIGESTIAGVGAKTHQHGFTGTLASVLSEELQTTISWNVYAKSGYTAKDITHKIIPTIKTQKVNIIVIGLGGNDSFKLHSPKRWRTDIHELIECLQLQFPNVPIIFANMPPIKEFTAFKGAIRFVIGNLVLLLGKELEKVVKQYANVYYFAKELKYDDMISELKLTATPEDFFSDGVHPSELAYQIWAEYMAKYILKNTILTV